MQKSQTSFSPQQNQQSAESFDVSDACGGIAIALRVNTNTVYVCKGLACVEHQIPVTTNTLFLTGSVSKQFVGALALRLAKDGIDLERDISSIVSDFPHKGIALLHLLNHTSGLRETEVLFALAGVREHDYLSPSDHLAVLSRQKSLLFRPGTQFAYTNINYLVAAWVLEHITKTRLPDLARNYLSKNTPLSVTRFHQHPDEILPNRAASYRVSNGNISRADRPFSTVGPSGLWSTAEELLMWAQFREDVFNDFSSVPLGQKELSAISCWSNAKIGRYGMGIISLKHPNGGLLHHSGADQGYSAEVCGVGRQVFIAVVSNNQSFLATRITHTILPQILRNRRANRRELKQLAEKLIETEFRSPAISDGRKPSCEVPLSLRKALEGTYLSDEALAPIRISATATGLELWRGGQRDVLRPIGKEKLAGAGYELTFSPEKNPRRILLSLLRAGCVEFQKT